MTTLHSVAELEKLRTEILARRAVPNQLTYLASNGHVHAQLKAALPFF